MTAIKLFQENSAVPRYQRSGMRKSVIMIMGLAVLIFVSASAIISQSSIKEMTTILRNQFNEEQMVIARSVKDSIEKDFSFLKREIIFLAQYVNKKNSAEGGLSSSLERVRHLGVEKIEIMENLPDDLSFAASDDSDTCPCLKISSIQIREEGLYLILASWADLARSQIIVYHVNLSWFFGRYLKNIRSGKTGYVWLIDDQGICLYHPETSFLGKDLFFAREQRDKEMDLTQINRIQREEMLMGKAGTGWYISGWHRGMTGRIEKLIAYSPVHISDSPDQNWSIAVVAPIAEIEEKIKELYEKQFIVQLVVICMILLVASVILFFEVRWSRKMEKEASRQTDNLIRSEETYRSLVETAEDLIFTVGPDFSVLSVNSFTLSFLSCKERGKQENIFSLFSGDMGQDLSAMIRNVFQEKKSIRQELYFASGKQPVHLDVNLVPIKDQENKVNSVLCIARDITDFKKMERHLVHTEKLASLGTLAAGIAHEINNPLGVIIGFCDLILGKAEPGSQTYEDVKIIERNGWTCKEIVENLLGFVRTGRDGEQIHTDINVCIRDTIAMAKPVFKNENIALETHLEDSLPRVKGESQKLQQVFLNLIKNAVDAMPEGGKLVVNTSLLPKEQMVQIRFRDQGICIDPNDIDHIFDPFFTTKPEGKGTGLGLFVSYGIVTGLGGTIECHCYETDDSDNSPGGTVFVVKLMTET